MRESAETVISRVLELGEKILWSGRPHVEVALERHSNRRRNGAIVGIGGLLLLIFWYSRQGLPNPIETLKSMPLEPKFLIPLVVILLVMTVPKMLKVDPKSRMDKYFNSLTYAITTERLLILEGNKVVDSYTPEQARQPVIRERAPGYADVNFDERGITNSDGEHFKDHVLRERRRAGFKSLPNGQEMKQRIEDWIQSHHQQAARQVADFVEAAPARHQEELPKGGSRITNPALGLTLDAPEEWQVHVRAKKKPQGKIFIDKENWQELGDTESWNLVRIEGPSRCRVEVEVFETPPTVSFEKLAQNKLADSIAGPVVGSQSDSEINGLRGFSITRRSDLQENKQYMEVGIAAMIAPERHTVLHDGRRQVYVISSWPEDSEDLKRAVDAVVESIEIT